MKKHVQKYLLFITFLFIIVNSKYKTYSIKAETNSTNYYDKSNQYIENLLQVYNTLVTTIDAREEYFNNYKQYMTLYNEASDNDGIARIYDDATIYNTAAGVNPFQYPDIDYFSSDYLKKAYYKTDATVEISGGDKKTQYYTNFGMSYNDDLVDYGDGLPYTRRSLSILNKISKKPGIAINKIIDEFDDAERDDIYPTLGQNLIWTLVGELAILDYIKLEDGREGKVTITETGEKKLADFKNSLSSEEKEALRM